MRRHHPPRPVLGHHPGHGMPGPMRGMRGPRPPPPPRMGIPPLSAVVPPQRLPGSISSCTNSNDPVSMDSRLFVGNLNTVALNKEAVEAIFSAYGTVSGISLHKGFAFVQFRHPDDARWAGATEDGKVYAGQALDINIVSQPKNRSAMKRSNSGKGNIESPKKIRHENSATANANQSLQRTLVTLSNDKPDNSDAKNSVLSNNSASKTTVTTAASRSTATAGGQPAAALQSKYTNCTSYLAGVGETDILICGNCKYQFPNMESLVQHKKVPCRLRFSCQCQNDSGNVPPLPSRLECAHCENVFVSAWALCVHSTQEHKLEIFKSDVKQETPVS